MEELLVFIRLRDLCRLQKAYERRLKAHATMSRRLLDRIRDYRSDALTRWSKTLSIKGSTWSMLKPRSVTSATDTKFEVLRDMSVFATGPNIRPDTYTLVAEVPLERITAIRLEVLTDARLPKGGPGRASNGNFVLSGLRVFRVTPGTRKKQRFRTQVARADFSQTNRQVTSVLGDNPGDGWAIYPHVGKDHVAVFEFREPIVNSRSARAQLVIELDHQLHHDHNLGRFRLSVTSARSPVPLRAPAARLGEIIKRPLDKWTGEDVLLAVQHFGYREEALDRLIAAEERHRSSQPKSPSETTKAQVISEMTPKRKTHVHLRGDFLSKGEAVSAGTPSVLPPLSMRGAKPDRLDLARWLVSQQIR